MPYHSSRYHSLGGKHIYTKTADKSNFKKPGWFKNSLLKISSVVYMTKIKCINISNEQIEKVNYFNLKIHSIACAHNNSCNG